jgi:hypothetical protein
MKMGWFQENKRHALAAQGVKTGRKISTNLAVRNSPIVKNRHEFEILKKDLKSDYRDLLKLISYANDNDTDWYKASVDVIDSINKTTEHIKMIYYDLHKGKVLFEPASLTMELAFLLRVTTGLGDPDDIILDDEGLEFIVEQNGLDKAIKIVEQILDTEDLDSYMKAQELLWGHKQRLHAKDFQFLYEIRVDEIPTKSLIKLIKKHGIEAETFEDIEIDAHSIEYKRGELSE